MGKGSGGSGATSSGCTGGGAGGCTGAVITGCRGAGFDATPGVAQPTNHWDRVAQASVAQSAAPRRKFVLKVIRSCCKTFRRFLFSKD
jgi:hypothetical protein